MVLPNPESATRAQRRPEAPAANSMDFNRIKEEAKHIPDGFLNAPGMCILPQFYMPETEELRWATHLNIRKSLFFNVFRSVKYCEFKRLKSEEEDFFELEKIVPLKDEHLIDKVIEKFWSGEKQRGKLLET